MKVQPDFGRPALTQEAQAPKEMLSVRTDEAGKLHFRINYSSLAVLLTCMQKVQFSLVRGLKGKGESPALVFGTAIHKALEVFYREPRANRSLPVNFAKVADSLPGLFSDEEYPKHFLYEAIMTFIRAAEPLRVLPASDKRSIDAGVWLLRHYFETYIDDPFVIMEDASGPLTERRCEAPLYDCPEFSITYFGTIDFILKNDKTGMILPGDHKTFSSKPSDFYKRVKPNHQYTGYVWLTRETLGIDCDTFLVNGVQVKPRPVTARGTPPHFSRQPTRRTDEDIAEFKRTVVWAVEQYIACTQESYWPLGDVNACAMYNGCQYQKICEVPRSIQQNIIEADYVEGAQDAEAK